MLAKLDLAAAQICFDGEQCWATPKFTVARRTPFRLAKYGQKGFTLLHPLAGGGLLGRLCDVQAESALAGNQHGLPGRLLLLKDFPEDGNSLQILLEVVTEETPHLHTFTGDQEWPQSIAFSPVSASSAWARSWQTPA